MLLMAGFQRPVMPLVEVTGKGLIVAPEANGPTAANKGTGAGLMVIVMVAPPALCPG